MKKFLIALLAFTLAVFACGCGTVSGGKTKKPGGSNGGNTNVDDTLFTVTLNYEGSAFIPEEGITARWTAMDGSNFIMDVPFDENGVATAEGLDGDYRVTLVTPPRGYMYNPNAYTATNYRKSVTIRLIKLLNAAGEGTDWYGNVKSFTQIGAYAINFTRAGQEIRCKFSPPDSGTFVIESIADITANEINPRIDIYGNSAVWTPEEPYESLNDGSDYSSIYTKNFKYTYDNPSGRNGLIAFVVKCDSRIDYPVTVYLIIDPNGASSSLRGMSMVVPTQTVNDDGSVKQSPEGHGTYVNFGLDDDGGLLDGERVYLDTVDGYYHVSTEDGDSSDTILYFTLSNRVVDFNDIEHVTYTLYNVNVKDENGNYKIDPVSGSYVTADFNYLFFLLGYEGVLTAVGESPESVLPEDLKNHEALKDKVSYFDTKNSGGKIAVTPELKEFLQRFSASRHIFNDGAGDAEHMGYLSSDKNQWLVFCGYYK
ncbi:MAG: hypothetical protein K2O28_05210 [Clostridia bacterium]|nr:hypothetical protein [Clostridia bacterium]